ncbi:aspartate-semialdehyde dehydrogenase [Plesiomonas sp.]|uniref:aspartate-semialdehyde dehydrogenase n=1 Tax=Plesiomonas sp. TaxID=2486279 RepID=UPI003F3DFC7E
MNEGWNIAILGATGAVGEALLTLLGESEFPVGQIYPLVSRAGDADTVLFKGKNIALQSADEFDWAEAQLAFFVASAEASERHAEQAADAGCLVIDSSGLFALDPSVPLVVPSVNPHVLAEFRNRNIVAVASAPVCQLLTAVNPLIETGALQRLSVTNLQSASALGKHAVADLAGQATRLLNGYPVEKSIFPKQLAFNMLPSAARVDDEGFAREERRLVDETRKVLQDDMLPIVAQCVQTPVFYGNAQSVTVETDFPLNTHTCADLLRDSADLTLMEEGDFPTQVSDASGVAHLSIGCLRNDYGLPQAVQFWSVADNVQFGGAMMALQTAERLINEYL